MNRRRAMAEGMALACSVPEPAPPREAEIYRGFRETIMRAHCARRADAHRCCGAITINADGIVFQCRLCGDSKQTIESETQ